MNARIIAAILAGTLMAGCSSAGTNGITPSGMSAANGASDAVASRKKHRRVRGYARFVIPQRKHKRGRKGDFVSGATQSASFVATSTNGTVTTIADLSSGSSDCTGGGAARTCTVSVLVPFGNDTIDVTTYDQAPSGGIIPASAQELGTGSTTQTVVDGVTPSITIFLSGLIGSIGVAPNFASLPADGNTSTAMFVIDPRDFGNKQIVAPSPGPSVTGVPYANPIAVTLTETGSVTSHSQLLKNGNPTGASATLNYSSDTIALQYDGAGKPGYTTTVSLKARGVSAMTAEVAPLYVTSSSIRSYTLGLNGTISNPTLAISETDAPSATTYTVTPTGCSGIATPTSASGTGASATFNVTGGTTPSATGCSISVADSNSPSSPLTLPTTNTPIMGTLTIGGVTLTDYGVGQETSALALGPDGNFWFTGVTSTNVGVINPATQQLVNFISIPSSSLTSIVTGPDGSMWVSDQSNDGVDRVTPGTYAVARYPNSNFTPQGLTSASDGTMYLGGQNSGDGEMFQVALGGLFTQLPAVVPSGLPNQLIQGPDGAIWFTETGAAEIGRYDPVSNNFVEISTVNQIPFSLCTGNDGNIWFTANGSPPYVGKIVPNGTGPYPAPTEFTVAGGANLTGIACGADNAIWYLDASTNDQVGRISLKSGYAQTVYTIPTGNAQAQAIQVGPDGTLLYTEGNSTNVGQIIP